MMHKWLIAITLLTLSPQALAKLNIFACEPEWASLAQEIGGDKIEAHAATTAHQDPHHIQARPSLLARARKADLLICSGAGLESGWLPILLKKSGNGAIQPGKPGHIMAADHVRLLEVLGSVSRSMGDVHASGNPHLHLDPRNILKVAAVVKQRLQEIDKANSGHYQQRHADFENKWRQAIKRWNKRGTSLRGMPVVVHHRSWVYLENWLGLKEIAALEPKPGLPPTSAHLAKVLKQVEKTPAKGIIHSPYQQSKSAKWLSGKSGIPVIELPYTIGGTPQARDLFGLFDDTINRLLAVSK
jgi:zinc/manganese transport system substrate-binding protein